MLHEHAAEGIRRTEEASTNWFLVGEGRRLTVLDTGFPRSWGTLERALDALAAIDAATTFVGHGDPWTRELRLAVELARAAGPS
jgi:glyoxylase-like metal-dependent hydrolase (beta-lactamase superfamily II)